MATAAPSAARCFAIAAPIPREPPVTSATISSSLFDILSPLNFARAGRGASYTPEVKQEQRAPGRGQCLLKSTAPDNPSLKQAHVALIDSPDFDATIERIIIKPIAQRPSAPFAA